MISLPGLSLNNPYQPTATGGLVGGGSPLASGFTPAIGGGQPAGGASGGGGSMDPLAGYNPFPGGGAPAGAAGGGGAGPTWTAANLPGGGLGPTPPPTYTPPAPATPGQDAVTQALVNKPAAPSPPTSMGSIPISTGGPSYAGVIPTSYGGPSQASAGPTTYTGPSYAGGGGATLGSGEPPAGAKPFVGGQVLPPNSQMKVYTVNGVPTTYVVPNAVGGQVVPTTSHR